MTRFSLIVFSSCLALSGWILLVADEPTVSPFQPPAKGPQVRPGNGDKGKNGGGDRPKTATDRKLPIPPSEMIKRFGGGPKKQQSVPPVALVGAKLVSMSDAGEIVGDILLQDGKITAIGPKLEIPEGATRIDAKGMVVTPGLIDVRSVYGLEGAERNASATDASLNPIDGFDPTNEDWKELLAQGVTAVCLQPSGALGGSVAVLRVGETPISEPAIVASATAVQGELNANPSSANTITRYSTYERLKGSLNAAKKYGEEWDKYREEVKKAEEKRRADAENKSGDKKEPAKELKDAKKEEKKEEKKEQPKETAEEIAKRMPGWDRIPEQMKPRVIEQIKRRMESGQPFAFGKGRRGGSGAASGPQRPKLEPPKELLLKVLKGEVPLRLEVHHPEDIKNAYKLADEFKIRLVLEGLFEAKLTADEIKKRRTPLVLGPFIEMEEVSRQQSQSPVPAFTRRGGFGGRGGQAPQPATPGQSRDWNRDAEWPNHLLNKDTKFAISTFAKESRESQLLRAHAAAAVAMGIEPEAALRAITKNAAEIAGVANRLGSLEVGKDADLVAFAGDPLNAAAPVAFVISAGRVVYKAATPTVESSIVRAELPKSLPANYSLTSKNVLDASGAFKPGKVTITAGQFATTAANGTTIDLGNAYVTPGLVAGPGDYGLSTGGGDEAAASGGAVHAGDAFDPTQKELRKLASGGFTNVLLAPSPAHVTAGVCASVRMGANPTVTDVGPLYALTDDARNSERFPASLSGQIEVVESIFTRPNDRLSFRADDSVRFYLDPTAPKDSIAIVCAESHAEVLGALRLAGQFGKKFTIVGPKDIRKHINQLKTTETAIVARPIARNDYGFATKQIAAAAKAGVPILFGGDDPISIRATAAMCINAGVEPSTAMKSLTTSAAAALGMPKGTATFNSGMPADFVVWSAPPWDLRSKVLAVVCDGKIVPIDQN